MEEPPKVHQQKSKSTSESGNNGTPRRKIPSLDVATSSKGLHAKSHDVENTKDKSVTKSNPNQSANVTTNEIGEKKIKYREQHTLHRGIIGFMDRELKGTTGKKGHSFSDPQESPAQHSIRSRSSLEKSPRRKRSKSESRRKREKKLIAAGELEVKQANETLMRYLKQCSQINDVSLSGELEIDHNFDERRVHRKTKSQRDKRGHSLNKKATKFYSANGITSILRDLPDDIIPRNGEIYNPFTPVVSPTEGVPARINKIFVQTSSGYRTVDNSYYQQPIGESLEESKPQNCVQLSYNIQKLWIKFSNICHGLLGGLALAHLILVATSKPHDWNETSAIHHPLFADIFADIFYMLLTLSVVSLFDRIDIRNVNLSNTSETISFRWIIISMLYISTIILTLCAETTDSTEITALHNTTNFQMQLVGTEDVWNSLAVARSFGAIIGWLMIGFSPSTDLLSSRLIEMERYYETKN